MFSPAPHRRSFRRSTMLLLAVSLYPQAQTPAVDRFAMNQVQVIGSHNSYKRAIEPALWKALRTDDAHKFESLEYAHSSFAEQLNLGLRILELDVVYDPKGGMFSNPLGLAMAGNTGAADSAAYDPAKEMLKPGFKVLHVPDIDFRTNAYTFRDALRQLRVWSDAHPAHLPIAITMNAKDTGADIPNAVRPLPFDAAAFDAWDAEIREVLPAAKLLTPDDVRADFPTLDAAVRSHAWPTLAKSRRNAVSK